MVYTFLLVSLCLISTSLSSEVRHCRESNVCSDGLKCCETQDDNHWCCSKNAVCCNRNSGCCTRHTYTNQATNEIHEQRLSSAFLKIDTGEVRTKDVIEVKTRIIDNELGVDNSVNLGSLRHNLVNPWKLDIFCPGRKQKCPRSYTCCLMDNERYGCCPYSDAVCCPDFVHCCPSNTACNVTTMACVPF